MSNNTTWHEKNDKHLSAAIEWLKLKLMTLAGPGYGKDGKLDEKATAAMNAKALQVTALESDDPLPALEFMRRRFGLSSFEYGILLLCVAMELDTRMPALCAKAHGDDSKPYPTFGLAMILFDDPAWDVLSIQRPLRYWRLIEVNRLMNLPLISSPLRVDERIINFVKGLNFLDERITRINAPFENDAGDIALPPSQQEMVDAISKDIQLRTRGRFPVVVQLVGPDAESKQLIAQKVAAALGVNLVLLPAELLPAQTHESDELARLWQRESLLLSVAGYIDIHNTSGTGMAEAGHITMGSLHRFLNISQGIFMIGTREMSAELLPLSMVVEIKKPTPLEQRMLWHELLGEQSNGSAAELAGQFNLNVNVIRNVVERVRAAATEEQTGDGDLLHRQLWSACLSTTGPELDRLVQKLDLKSKWNDIVLPEVAIEQLHQIASQVKYRSTVYDSWGYREKMNQGLGINALFVGESGTGKTMAAEVLANELNLHLYRIDLSGVVSKYIGETEKNLRKVFDAAEKGGAILFFDEADALFGKRSEIKDSHDRYANIEINYLLQRMEAYNGLAILATNKKSALDEAFLRRLRFIVHFPFPGVRERKVIAEKMFPPALPKAQLDYDRLAALNLTGGSFYNVAINAAFKAAAKGGPVTMPLILSAAKAEFQKMERPVRESDFVWHE